MQAVPMIQETPVEVQLRATSRQLCETATQVVIMSRQDLSEATDLVKLIKTRAKEIEEERTGMVKPFNEGVKQINSRFKAMLVPLEEAESDLKGKMLVFQQEEARKVEAERRRFEEAQREQQRKEAEERRVREEEERKAWEAAEAKRVAETPEAPPTPTPAPTPEPTMAPLVVAPPSTQHRPTTYGQSGAVSTVKKQWAFEIVDIRALAAARPDLVSVDQVKVNQEIRGRGGDIPGLRIFQKDILQVK
jgi:hypothetical protein